MTCYKSGGCGVYEMYSCSECPASKPEYANKNKEAEWVYDHWCEFKCSNCGQPYFNRERLRKRYNFGFNFCPFCGATMLHFEAAPDDPKEELNEN